jgi:hypothetical protein
MCGIVGIINHKGTYLAGAERLMKDMLIMNQVRGTDGTGIFWSRGGKTVGWSKLHSHAMEFLDNQEAAEPLRQAEHYHFLVGHNRAATSGGVTIETTQPIEDGSICLVHNGTLSGWPTKWKDGHYNPNKGTEHVMDTMGIAHLLQHRDIRYVNEHCYGAMSLVWYDDRDQSLNFFRNRDRPMWLLPTERCTLFGSEPGLLVWAAGRNSFDRGKEDLISPTKPFTHYKFYKKESKPRVWDIPEKSYTVYPQYQNNRYNAGSSSNSGTSHSPETEQEDDTPASTPVEGTKNGKIIPIVGRKNIKIKQVPVEKYQHYKVGAVATFSLADIKRKKNANQRFLEIEGNPVDQGARDAYMFHANVNLDERELYDNDRFLKGEVASMTREKSTGFVHIFLKDVSITKTEDPEWAKPKKKATATQEPPKVIGDARQSGYQGRIGALEREISALEKPKEPKDLDLENTQFQCASCKKAVGGKDASQITFKWKIKNGTGRLQSMSKYICRSCVGSWSEHGTEVLLPDDLKSPLVDLVSTSVQAVCKPSPTIH